MKRFCFVAQVFSPFVLTAGESMTFCDLVFKPGKSLAWMKTGGTAFDAMFSPHGKFSTSEGSSNARMLSSSNLGGADTWIPIDC